SYLDSDQVVGRLGIQKKFASVTFGNLNLYNFILVISAPILSSFFLGNFTKSWFLKRYTVIVLLATFVIIIMNGSRAAAVSYILSLLLFSWYYFKINSLNKLFFLRI